MLQYFINPHQKDKKKWIKFFIGKTTRIINIINICQS